MKLFKSILGLVAAVGLMAGCASNQNQGATGNDTQNGYGNGQNAPATTINAPPSGPNGSISRSNPFGAGSGSGLQRAD